MAIILAGLEIVEESIGEGGSAIVHKARVSEEIEGLPKVGEFVAIKVYRDSILQHANQDARITQERTIGATIQHPNVVKVFDGPPLASGETPSYLVMEWVDGPTLDVWCEDLRKNAAWDRIRGVCLNVVDGVMALHEKSIMHRDIKPENIMVKDDTAKLMDIGVAEVTGSNDHTLHTAVKDFVGSVRYASPQFVMGENYDVKDDVYSVGATLLLVLTGRIPYSDVERKPVLPIEVTRRPPEVGKLRDNVPPVLRVVLQGCLHRNRERRPTLEQLREALVNGGASPYVDAELRRQATESGFTVIRLDSAGSGFYADVGDEHPETGRVYTVVRRTAPVQVPSLGTDVAPEKWIASAELRHVHQSVGHFKMTVRTWIPEKSPTHVFGFPIGASGHWLTRDLKTEQVEVGDVVVRHPTDE